LVTSSSLSYEGSVTVTIQYDEIMVNQSGPSESDVRFLHYTSEGSWEDRTASVNTTANTVTGQLGSLSPIVAVVVSDGTYGPIYFELNPLARIVDVPATNDNASDMKNGPIIISRNTTTIHAGDQIRISNTVKNLQRSSQQYDYIIEVFDKDNVTIDLMVKSGTLDGGKSINISQDWIAPKESGVYTIKIILLQGLNSPIPMLLKNSTSTEISVA